jgi:hypothetical protein
MNWVLGNTVLDGSSVPYDPIVIRKRNSTLFLLNPQTYKSAKKKIKEVFESTAMVQKNHDTKLC